MAEQSLLFNPKRLHIHNCAGGITGRRYTLTHSDTTGELFLTIAPEFDPGQVSGWYTRFMRDEVLGEWLFEGTTVPAYPLPCQRRSGLWHRRLPLWNIQGAPSAGAAGDLQR